MSINPDFIRKIKKGDLHAFESLYRDYYKMLCIIANNYVNDKLAAEEIVGDVFFKIWEKKDTLTINVSFKSYLIRSVQNRSINYLEKLQSDKKQKEKFTSENTNTEYIPYSSDYQLGKLFEEELLAIIQNTILSLPEQCRKIFALSFKA